MRHLPFARADTALPVPHNRNIATCHLSPVTCQSQAYFKRGET
jgi:hypothetical protein